MLGWISRILLMSGGLIASFWVARDADNFEVVRFVVTLLLFTALVAIAAYRREIRDAFLRVFKKKK